MKIDVIGYEKLDFTNDQGQRVQGVNLYYTTPCNPTFGFGVKGAKKWVSPQLGEGVKLGKADVEADLSGHITSIKYGAV